MSDFKVSFSLEGRVVVVTGGAQGIGQGVAVAAAGVGADVAVVDLDEAAAAETVALVEAEGRRALAVGVDVGDRDAVLAAFDRIVAELGRIDGLVNCAAVISENVPVEEATEADLDRLWRVNVKGSLFCAQAAFRDMQPRGQRVDREPRVPGGAPVAAQPGRVHRDEGRGRRDDPQPGDRLGDRTASA